MSSTFKKICLWAIRVLTVLILFLPLLVSHNTLYPYIFGKVIVFRISVELMLAFWLFLAIYDKRYRPDWKNPLVLGLTIFVGILFLTAISGVDFNRSFWSTQERMTGVLTLIHCWLWFIILTSVFSSPSSKKDWLRFIWVDLIVSFVVGFSGIAQKFGWKFLLQAMPGTRMSATLGNPDFLAIYAMINIFLAIFLIVAEKKIYLKILASFLAIFNLAIVVLTATRAAALSLGLTLILFLIFLLFIRSKKKKIIITKILASFLLVVTIGGGIFLYTHRTAHWIKKMPFIVQRVMSISPKTNQGRLDSWKIGIQGFKEKPILGWGWENYNIVFNKYYKPWYMENGSSATWFDKSHNQIIDLLASTGIIGTLVYLFIFASIFYLLFRKKTYQKLISIILACLFFAYFIDNLFVFDTPATLIIFYFSLSLVYFVTNNKQNNLINEDKPKPEQDNKFPLPVLIFLIIIFIPWIMDKFNFEPLRQSILGIKAVSLSRVDIKKGLAEYKKSLANPCFTNAEIRLQLMKTALKIDSKDENYQSGLKLAIDEMEKNVEEHLYDVRYYFYLGRLYNLGGYSHEAQAILEKALLLSPKRQQIYYELIQSKIAEKKNKQAINLAKKVLSLDDKVKESHWSLGVAYLADKEYKDGLKEVETAHKMGYRYSTNPNFLLYLAKAYSNIGDYKKSISFCDNILKDDPKNIEATIYKAIYLAKLGDNQGVHQIVENLSKINLNASHLLQEELDKIKK